MQKIFRKAPSKSDSNLKQNVSVQETCPVIVTFLLQSTAKTLQPTDREHASFLRPLLIAVFSSEKHLIYVCIYFFVLEIFYIMILFVLMTLVWLFGGLHLAFGAEWMIIVFALFDGILVSDFVKHLSSYKQIFADVSVYIL